MRRQSTFKGTFGKKQSFWGDFVGWGVPSAVKTYKCRLPSLFKRHCRPISRDFPHYESYYVTVCHFFKGLCLTA